MICGLGSQKGNLDDAALAARGSDINEDGVVNILDFVLMAEYWLESTIY